MEQKRQNLYLIDMKYVRNLAKADDHVYVDFTKIMDGEKLIGVLNFNNMIPVDESCTIPLNLRIVG